MAAPEPDAHPPLTSTADIELAQQFTQTLGETLSMPGQVSALAPITLAYIGDAVYELYIRSRFLWPPQRLQHYHQQVVKQVRAEQQALHLDQLQTQLTEAERQILRRGRNAAPKRHRRVNAGNYQKATSFEALIGYLYITDQVRLYGLLDQLDLCS
jgi:ribonuclease-3 family protein